MTLVFPVQGPPYTNKGSIGEFKGPKRRTISRIWFLLPGKLEIMSSRLIGSPPTKRSLIVKGSRLFTFAEITLFEVDVGDEAEDLVILLGVCEVFSLSIVSTADDP
ncbi:hypothetical protein V8G54_018913 [Vigna mungo]|uniref:Uncharacterized protein n=1 Tax=Vigna mungo TaxID=3915 RepID=A0AAQ3RT52_VIGMU